MSRKINVGIGIIELIKGTQKKQFQKRTIVNGKGLYKWTENLPTEVHVISLKVADKDLMSLRDGVGNDLYKNSAQEEKKQV